METIRNVGTGIGNADAGDLTKPHDIEESFHYTGALVRLASVLLVIAAVLVIAVGVFSLVFPVAIVGMVGLVGAGVLFWQAENIADLTKVK
jgi:Flp pilus assembly protein TadB